ncbi:hypothetical protein GCM10009798_43980 [Nocardioides panacihumi]|uniref:DUF3046 domain-containing protein n=1 Tax=Nocardioides panacihumi TaxID=400774 RepID=A0ABN2S003_9ACTN
MRHTEFWARMERALGAGYYEAWADQFVMSALGGRTARQALDAGYSPLQVWRAVHDTLGLPPSER